MGVTNGWSLFSGTLNSQNYNALSLGLGRDLLSWGLFQEILRTRFLNYRVKSAYMVAHIV